MERQSMFSARTGEV